MLHYWFYYNVELRESDQTWQISRLISVFATLLVLLGCGSDNNKQLGRP